MRKLTIERTSINIVGGAAALLLVLAPLRSLGLLALLQLLLLDHSTLESARTRRLFVLLIDFLHLHLVVVEFVEELFVVEVLEVVRDEGKPADDKFDVLVLQLQLPEQVYEIGFTDRVDAVALLLECCP